MMNSKMNLKEVQKITKGFKGDIVVNTVPDGVVFQEIILDKDYLNNDITIDAFYGTSDTNIKDFNIDKKILKSILKIKNNEVIEFDNESGSIKTETKEIKVSESNSIFNNEFYNMEFEILDSILIEDFIKGFQDSNISKDVHKRDLLYYHLINKHVYTCDGYRITRRSADIHDEIYIHHVLVDYILKNKKLFDKVTFYENDMFIKLQVYHNEINGFVNLYQKKHTPDFKLDRLISDEYSFGINLNKIDFINELEFIKSVEKSKAVDLKFDLENQLLNCSNEDKNYKFNIKFDIEFDNKILKEGKDFEICININYLIDALKSKNYKKNENININYITNTNLFNITNGEDDNYILPVRKNK